MTVRQETSVNSIRIKIVTSFILVFGLATNVAMAAVDRVLVIVNEDVITQSEFDYRCAEADKRV